MSPTPADETQRREVLRDLATGALSLVLAGGLAAVHFGQAGRLHDDYGREPGPALMPEILLAALGVAGAGMLLRGAFFCWRERVSPVSWPVFWTGAGGLRALGTPLAVVALLVGFLIARGAVGFGLAAACLSAAVAMILARQEGRGLPRAALEGIAIAVVLYALFRLVLSVPLT